MALAILMRPGGYGFLGFLLLVLVVSVDFLFISVPLCSGIPLCPFLSPTGKVESHGDCSAKTTVPNTGSG